MNGLICRFHFLFTLTFIFNMPINLTDDRRNIIDRFCVRAHASLNRLTKTPTDTRHLE